MCIAVTDIMRYSVTKITWSSYIQSPVISLMIHLTVITLRHLKNVNYIKYVMLVLLTPTHAPKHKLVSFRLHLSRLMTKSTKRYVRLAKTQISLLSRVVAVRMNIRYLATHWAHYEDSDQTGRMPRLIWVFAGRTCHCVGFVTRRLNSFLRLKGGITFCTCITTNYRL